MEVVIFGWRSDESRALCTRYMLTREKAPVLRYNGKKAFELRDRVEVGGRTDFFRTRSLQYLRWDKYLRFLVRK